MSTTTDALASSPGWRAIASAPTARGQHATVLLPNGKLLVAAGVNSMGFVTKAELFDPDTASWSSAADGGPRGNVTLAQLLPNGHALLLSDGSALGKLYDPRADAWQDTGAMASSRSLPTMSLLSSGKLLVVGGVGAGGVRLRSAELYDPATNTFTATGSMRLGRNAHTAAVLRDGRVLVASGFDGAGQIPSAELYDPVSETWSDAAPPLVPRHYASATLLTDGRVLLTGGLGAGGALTQSELYDPAANTWTATGSLALARSGHTATLLPSGKVLVVGGATPGAPARAAGELYDPSTGVWSPAGNTSEATQNHTATLMPSGKVLIVGGFDSRPMTTFFARAELYDPSVSAWSPAGVMATARTGAVSARLPSGKLLVAGGRSAGSVALATTELYDLAANTWAPGAALAAARERATASLLPSGHVFVTGGTADGALSLASSERYDAAANAWAARAAMRTARHDHSAAVLPNGDVVVVGGLTGSSTTGSVERYDAANDTWALKAALATARSRHASVVLANGLILVAGGRAASGTALASVELYDPTTDTWSSKASLPGAREGLRLTLLGSGRVLASGGANAGVPVGATAIYDPLLDTWSAAGNLGEPRSDHHTALLPSGSVLVVGGRIATGDATSAELFDPSWGAWRNVHDPLSRRATALATLASGDVLLAGGVAAVTAEKLVVGGAQPAWRPSVEQVSALITGCTAHVEGRLFRGVSEASGGSYLASRANFPLLRLQALEGSRVWTAPSADWSATTATIQVPADMPAGAYALHVLTNGLSGGRMVTVATNAAPRAADKSVIGSVGAPIPIVIEGSDPLGQTLAFTVVTPPEHGTLSGAAPALTYTPDDGHVGADAFTFRTRNCGLDSAEATVTITTLPKEVLLECPANVRVEAEDADGARASWPDAIVTSDENPAPTVRYAPEPGTRLPLGTTSVTATAQSVDGPTATCAFQVSVEDTTAPALACPSPLSLAASGPDGAIATFEPTATDAVSAPTVTATPASGSVFPLGTTQVEVRATDSAGNTATCAFDVTVTPQENPGAPDDTPADAPDDADGGCGCHHAGSTRSTPWAGTVGLAGLALLLLRRRR